MRNRSVVPALLLAVVLAIAVPVAYADVCIAPPNPNNPFWLWSKFCEMCESHGGTFWGADGSDRHNRTTVTPADSLTAQRGGAPASCVRRARPAAR